MAERVRMGRGLGLGVMLLLLMTAGCNPVPVRVAARPLTPIAAGEIRRIAIVPFTTLDPDWQRAPEPGAEPITEPPGDTVTRAMRAAMASQGDWQIIDDLTVGEAMRQSYGGGRPPTASEAQAVGTLLRADAVLRGEVRTFDERIGSELAAKQAAHVVFAVELVRRSDGAAAWQGEYAEQQQSLGDNLWNLPGFVRAGGTWVRAGELAELGANQLATKLHTALYGPPAAKRSGKKPR